MSVPSTVFIVEDDAELVASLNALLRAMPLEVETFPTGQAFLDAYRDSQPGCLVVNMTLPDMDGLALQRRLAERNQRLPIVFISRYCEIKIVVEAMQAGAIDFLLKPLRQDRLLQSIKLALEKDAHLRRKEAKCAEVRQRVATLSPRERQVMDLLVGGKTNRQIAAQMLITIKTVEHHRSQVLKKMAVEHVPGLVLTIVTCLG